SLQLGALDSPGLIHRALSDRPGNPAEAIGRGRLRPIRSGRSTRFTASVRAQSPHRAAIDESLSAGMGDDRDGGESQVQLIEKTLEQLLESRQLGIEGMVTVEHV